MARQKKNANGYYTKTFIYEGKRYYSYGKTPTEAYKKAEEKKLQLIQEEKELEEKRNNPTLSAYYEYFTEIRKTEVKQSTIRGQIYQFRNISEVMLNNKPFGSYQIRDITRRDIEQVRQIMLKDGKTPEYLNICFAHLNHVFASALLDDTIEKNPCRALKQLKRIEKPIAETKHRALSENETILFFKAAEERNSYFLNMFNFMINSGVRVGELGALLLTDIDKDFIHIRRTITRNELGQYEIGKDTKTYSGKREIPLTPALKQIIKQQKELNNMLFGLGWSGTLFKSPEGELLREYTVNREIKRICKKADIEKFTCHGFRVTFATRFIEQRPQDFKILSEIMGHKDIAITMNIYTRVMNESKITAMKDFKIKTS